MQAQVKCKRVQVQVQVKSHAETPQHVVSCCGHSCLRLVVVMIQVVTLSVELDQALQELLSHVARMRIKGSDRLVVKAFVLPEFYV